MTELEVLREARALIERLGWCQGHFQDKTGAVCAIGALNRAATDSEREWRAACMRLQQLVPDGHIAGWNDALGRTKPDVLALYDRAIAEYEAEQVQE